MVLPCMPGDKALLLEAVPEIDVERDCYRGRPLMLARIEAISEKELRHRVEIAWRIGATGRMVRGGEGGSARGAETDAG